MARNKATGEPIDLTLRIKTEVDNKSVDAVTDRVIKKFDDVKPAVERANAMVERFKQSLAKIDSGEGLTKTDIRLHKIAREAQDSAQYIINMYEKMNQNVPGTSHTALEFADLTKQTEALYGSIDTLKAKIEETRSTLESAEEESKKYIAGFNAYSENLYKDIVSTNASIMQLSKEMKHTDPGTERYREISTQLSLLKSHLAEVRAEYLNLEDSVQQYRKDDAKANVEALNAKLVELTEILTNLSTTSKEENFIPAISMGDAIGKELEKLAKYEAEIRQVELSANASGKAQERMGNASAKAHQKGVTYARRHRSILQSLLRVLHKIVDAFKKLRTHTHKAFDSSNNGLKLALRNIMRYGLGVRSLYFLFRRLRKATKDAFGVMAQQWEPVNEQISSMIKSLNAVKGSLATMLQPLLGTFSAFFNSMMGVLQNIMETIGAFFAALTGQDYILRAHAGDVDWAESLADDLGTAADNAEELNKQLAGFDKINNLTTNKDKKGKTDIGVGTVTYEKIPIEKLEIYSWLKEMWDKSDFSDLGRMLNSKLLNMFKKLDWDDIEKVGKKIGKCIATGFNGFFENKKLAKEIGKAIAGALNTAFGFIGEFASTFKWDDLGLFLKKGIQSFLDRADTYDWGFSVGSLVSGIATSVYTLVSDPKTWENLGTKIKEGISGMLDALAKPRWVKIDEKLDMNGHLQPIYKQMNGWELAAGALSGFVTGLIDTLNDALDDEANWERFVEGVGQFIANIKWADVFKKIANFAKNILDGIVTAVQAAYDADPTFFTNTLNIGFAIAVTSVALKTAASLITGMITSKLVEAGVLTEGVAGASAGLTGAGMLYLAIPISLLLLLHSIDVATDQAAREKFGNEVADEINTIPEETKKALGPACVEGGVADGGWAFKIATRISMLVTTDDEGKPEGWTTKLGNYLTDKKKNPLGARIIEWFSSSMKDSQSDMTTQAETSINTALSDVNIDSTALESQSDKLGKSIKSGFNGEFINDTELSGPNSPMQKSFQKGVDGVREDVFDVNSPSKVFKAIGASVIEGFLLPFKDLPDLFKKVWITAQNASVTSINRMRVVVSNALNTVAGNIKAIMQTMLSNIGDSLGSIVTTVKTKLKGALESSISFDGITNSLSTVNKQWENMWSNMADVTKKKANSIIDSMNGMLNGLEILANTQADGTLATGKAAKTFPRIPHLAQGAVIPPNKQFLAVLGDQKQGTNVEAPVSVIEDAVGRALKKYGVNVTFDVQGDPNGMFKVMQRKSNEFNRRTGLPSFT